jgi:asparagine synthase (glutamine-hydrolysing)
MRFVERIPAGMRAGVREGKAIHRRAVEPLVPREALERPKHGFSTPYDSWLRTSLGIEVEQRYQPGTELAGLIEPAEVARLVAEHRTGRDDHKNVLYCLLELSEWHRSFVEGRVTSAAVAG